jgi:nicotinamide-nucleotide amidase
MVAETARKPANKIVEFLSAKGLSITTAESCTAGLIAGALTGVPGSSAVFYGGFITYSNEAKHQMIGVPRRLIEDYGAVSAQVARAMADGARNTARTDYAIAVTGIAGPGGGSDKKPVGLVYLAFASSEETTVVEKNFGPLARDEIRSKSVDAALELIYATISAVEVGVNAQRQR